MKAVVLSILVLLVSGCEFWVAPHPSHHSYSEYVVVTDAAYDPNYFDYPHNWEPEACYSHHGTTFCEWVYYSQPYTECIETWYYDEYWRLWDFFHEECYAI